MSESIAAGQGKRLHIKLFAARICSFLFVHLKNPRFISPRLDPSGALDRPLPLGWAVCRTPDATRE
ncbi:hypothetical protein EYF80_049079 [Liparis tanakae]|uniref:Uncharacterized protein n=1 Tax=Liparis tanakae TaxID=230148 RepID=A0A4Z2FJ08_9TELE|nr:hypothetical protein EYF80_049079 [Liparis tanakae]